MKKTPKSKISLIFTVPIALLFGSVWPEGRPVLANPPGGPSSDLSVEYDFCTATESPAGRGTALALWNAETVQAQTTRLTLEPDLADTPWNAYPIVYVALTDARDFERCHGMLATKNRSHQLIGDLLADLMSRWLVLSMSQCATDPAQGDQRYGFCAALDRIRSQGLDTLSATLEITSVYLSSHMAMALAAVVRDDLFWNQEFPSQTHCLPGKSCPASTIEQRITRVKDYKKHYDLNNKFLAKNTATIIATLRRACYVKGGILEASAALANNLPGLELLLGRIRDKTFQAGIELARTIDPKRHPMLEKNSEGLFQRQFSQIRFFEIMPQPLASTEHDARHLLHGPLFLTRIFSGLGSRSWADLAANPPSNNSLCTSRL